MIGRKKEINTLLKARDSVESEFVAVYGRRRVGKTFLVRETFDRKFTFEHSGVARKSNRIQLRMFRKSLMAFGYVGCPPLKDWFDAFDGLKKVIADSAAEKKLVFIDEVPWMDRPGSDLLSALEHFWNSWASARKDVLLVICGSATSWMLNKVIHDRGGLHNRVTYRIRVDPFTLSECEEYADYLGLEVTRRQLVEYYMALGGVAYYWKFLERGLSVAQNMDSLFFMGDEKLEDEFDELYSSLFVRKEPFVKLITALGSRKSGMTRDELSEATGLGNSGTMTRRLKELEKCGFIRKYSMCGRRTRGAVYQLIDNFTLFHFRFVAENRKHDRHFWTNSLDAGFKAAWEGLSFEIVCLEHVNAIKSALGISGVSSNEYAWRCQHPESPEDKGAQIDLLIDRKDGIINLCEMKFTSEPYALTEEDETKLIHRKNLFKRENDIDKAIHLTMVTSSGVKMNRYAGSIQAFVTLDELFGE